MTEAPLSAKDFPIAETRPARVVGRRGKPLEALTLEAAVSGDIEMEDLRITPQALLQQAQIARSVGRSALGANMERAAEMTRIPQDEVMRIYELLRPGRATSSEVLMATAQDLRERFDAPLLADFLQEAARLYEQRGLFQKRY